MEAVGRIWLAEELTLVLDPRMLAAELLHFFPRLDCPLLVGLHPLALCGELLLHFFQGLLNLIELVLQMVDFLALVVAVRLLRLELLLQFLDLAKLCVIECCEFLLLRESRLCLLVDFCGFKLD